MPVRALRQFGDDLSPKEKQLPTNTLNARKGIKTRIEHMARYRLAQATNTLNARKGIKTALIPAGFAVLPNSYEYTECP